MQIVVLDGYCLNPGDLSWAALEALGDVTVYPRTAAQETVVRLRGAQVALTNKAVISAEDINQLPDLRYIGVLATGYNNVDVAAASRQAITVTNVPSYSTDSVAQLTIALLLELCLHAGDHSQAVHRGEWESSPDFSFRLSPLTELTGKTMGIIGYGRIGRASARIARAFGMRVLVTGRPGVSLSVPHMGVEPVSLEALLGHSDFVSLHCPLTPETAQIISTQTLELMKPGSFLINTSRGGLIDEEAVSKALHSGHLGGAGLDVLSTEPPSSDNPLLHAPRCIITPHIAWATKQARERMIHEACSNLRAFLSGSPINVVSA
ncbi:MAG: D-2-hydroxyacid dehydrogenase [Armatimonadetes bacterium]|nr:D-2-hydroxyacid dehydrogenase [Armatimonadota bacterium]